MAIATIFKSYLDHEHIHYETVAHPHSATAMETALAAGVPMAQVAKSVVFKDEKGQYLLAVMPALCRAEINKLNALTNHRLELVDESELSELFADCERGAIPPAGIAYAMPMVWDDMLSEETDLFVEAGDHEHLLHLERDGFSRLMGNSAHGHFSRPEVSPG